MAERKVMVGQRVRRLRQTKSITQAQMASQLGISPSYLNLIERNQRPATVQFLLRLAQTFDIDLVQFAGDDEGRLVAQLREVFADTIFNGSNVSSQDIQDLVSASPLASEAIFKLYMSYRELSETVTIGLSRGENPEGSQSTETIHTSSSASANDAVLDFIQSQDNYFPELESLVEESIELFNFKEGHLLTSISRVLEERHGVRLRILPLDIMEDTLRRYDRHGKRVLISEALQPEGQVFQLAYQFAMLEWQKSIENIAENAHLKDHSAKGLLKVALTDYSASALLMPYLSFHQAVNDLRYDFTLLARRFGVPLEQVCFRMATLQRAGAKGVPIFLLQVDAAGNLIRRFSANGFHPPRFGGLCPRWNPYASGAGNYSVLPIRFRMPDGSDFISFSMRIARMGNIGVTPDDPILATIVGCDLEQASMFSHADSLRLDTEVNIISAGTNCRLCPRSDCAHRAEPPHSRKLIVDENYFGRSPYFFA